MSGIYGAWTITLPVPLLAWLATTELRQAVAGMRVLYGVLRFLHLVGMAGFLGLLLALALHGLGLLAQGALGPARPVLARVLTLCFWSSIATGVCLFLYDPLGTGLHSMFLPKLVLVSAGYAFARARPRISPRATAWVSLAIWLAVIGASTWNKVERPVQINAALRASNLGRNNTK